MILPGKHLRQDRSLLGIGSAVLKCLDDDGRTVSELWEFFRENPAAGRTTGTQLTFDWFVLSLSFLYAINVITFEQGVIYRRGAS